MSQPADTTNKSSSNNLTRQVAQYSLAAGVSMLSLAAPAAAEVVVTNIQNQSGPSLGMLALGSVALPMWRREETLGAK
jgi:hypothetical protein